MFSAIIRHRKCQFVNIIHTVKSVQKSVNSSTWLSVQFNQPVRTYRLSRTKLVKDKGNNVNKPVTGNSNSKSIPKISELRRLIQAARPERWKIIGMKLSSYSSKSTL